MSNHLQAIENQLDRIDLALTEDRLDEIPLPAWQAPDADLGADESEHLGRLLARLEGTIARVEAAKAESAAALDELRRRRQATRAYSA